ncbi:MAG: asparagine synthase-related protein [Thiobacillus sp.]|nr:asparagine synthase-related protein [Thiobacillus sp.]
MPGILCSAFNPNAPGVSPKWCQGLELLRHHPEHVVEQYSEPGFHLACVYHPEVCQGPRILIGEHHVLAYYGNIYEDHWAHLDETQGLTQVLLNAFAEHGPDGLKHLNGRYDIVVWDRRARVLHHVGDRFGANRHYLLKPPGALHLACEVKALAPFLDRLAIDPAGLASMLNFGFHLGDLTLLQDVKCLPNARVIQYRAGADELALDSYWAYPYGEQTPWDGTEAALGEALYQHLDRALKRSLHGVNKILLPISGGLDSRAMAGLLAGSGFSGEVLAYSYGQASSRDVRYGRAIAKKLGYRHITIPTPDDFVTRHLKEAAWYFDAEWSAELNWGPRFSHLHPSLGDTRGYRVLSGMFGDLILGEGAFVGAYRRLCGDDPQPIVQLLRAFFKCNQEYCPQTDTRALFQQAAADEAHARLQDIVNNTLLPFSSQRPFFALNRSEFLHRQRRHTATVAQSAEYDRKVITPFLDRDVVDFATRIPYPLLCDKILYKHMIRDHLPTVAAVPYGKTALPLSHAPIRAALQWRLQKLLTQFPGLAKRINKNHSNFLFQETILGQSEAFRVMGEALDTLSPPLDIHKARTHYLDILAGRIRPADQIAAFLPPALFLRTLRQQCTARPAADNTGMESGS